MGASLPLQPELSRKVHPSRVRVGVREQRVRDQLAFACGEASVVWHGQGAADHLATHSLDPAVVGAGYMLGSGASAQLQAALEGGMAAAGAVDDSFSEMTLVRECRDQLVGGFSLL